MITLTDAEIDAVRDSMPERLTNVIRGWWWREFARSILAAQDALNAPEPKTALTLLEARDRRVEEWMNSPAIPNTTGKSFVGGLAERAFKAGYEASMLDYALALQLRAKARGSIQMEEEFKNQNELGPNTKEAADWAERNLTDSSMEP